jgi:hypothetical protein
MDANVSLRLTALRMWRTDPTSIVFGVASGEVARIEWLVSSEPAWSERTDCRSRILEPGTCVLVALRSGPGTAVGYDAHGNETDRVEFG